MNEYQELYRKKYHLLQKIQHFRHTLYTELYYSYEFLLSHKAYSMWQYNKQSSFKEIDSSSIIYFQTHQCNYI